MPNRIIATDTTISGLQPGDVFVWGHVAKDINEAYVSAQADFEGQGPSAMIFDQPSAVAIRPVSETGDGDNHTAVTTVKVLTE